MKLSKTSAHAALALAYLAGQSDDQVIQAHAVARHLKIPTDSALKVLQNLARRGLVHSRLGRHGGYLMHRPAAQITLLEVVEATDGPIDSQLPLLQRGLDGLDGADVLRTVCHQVARKVRQELESTTVAHLAHAYRARGQTGPRQPTA